VVSALRAQHHDRLKHVHHDTDRDHPHGKHADVHDEIELLLIAVEREHINKLSRSGELKDEARRRIERELDLREADIANQHAED
jgi:CPA1 family monovalent cation:H+ antiporter